MEDGRSPWTKSQIPTSPTKHYTTPGGTLAAVIYIDLDGVSNASTAPVDACEAVQAGETRKKVHEITANTKLKCTAVPGA